MNYLVKTPSNRTIVVSVPLDSGLSLVGRAGPPESPLGVLSDELLLEVLRWVPVKSLSLFCLTSRGMYVKCSDDWLWKKVAPGAEWVKGYGAGGEGEVLGVSPSCWRSCYWRWMRASFNVKRSWKQLNRFFILDWNPGISILEIEKQEKKISSFKFPFQFKVFYTIANGQPKLQSLPQCLIGGARFLEVQEIVFALFEGFTGDYFPFTTVSGNQQWFAGMDGAVYLGGGWNKTLYAKDLVHFLHYLSG